MHLERDVNLVVDALLPGLLVFHCKTENHKFFTSKDLIKLIISNCAYILEMVSSLSFKIDLFRINTASHLWIGK